MIFGARQVAAACMLGFCALVCDADAAGLKWDRDRPLRAPTMAVECLDHFKRHRGVRACILWDEDRKTAIVVPNPKPISAIKCPMPDYIGRTTPYDGRLPGLCS